MRCLQITEGGIWVIKERESANFPPKPGAFPSATRMPVDVGLTVSNELGMELYNEGC